VPVLDTSYVVDFLEGEEDAVTIFDMLRQGSAPLGVTSYTHFELYAGIGRSQQPDRERRQVVNFLEGLTLFDFEPEAARQAGLLDVELAASGEPVGLVDLMIAATALHHGQSVVTRDPEGFERVPGLEVLTY
jgi:predicted nucleic acid-binding protein